MWRPWLQVTILKPEEPRPPRKLPQPDVTVTAAQAPLASTLTGQTPWLQQTPEEWQEGTRLSWPLCTRWRMLGPFTDSSPLLWAGWTLTGSRAGALSEEMLGSGGLARGEFSSPARSKRCSSSGPGGWGSVLSY